MQLVPPVRLKPTTPPARVKHSTTKLGAHIYDIYSSPLDGCTYTLKNPFTNVVSYIISINVQIWSDLKTT